MGYAPPPRYNSFEPTPRLAPGPDEYRKRGWQPLVGKPGKPHAGGNPGWCGTQRGAPRHSLGFDRTPHPRGIGGQTVGRRGKGPRGVITPGAGPGKVGRVPPAAGSEPIAPRRVRSWPVLRVSQGTRGPRETGGPADPGSHNRGRTIARPVTGRVRLPPFSETGRLGSATPTPCPVVPRAPEPRRGKRVAAAAWAKRRREPVAYQVLTREPPGPMGQGLSPVPRGLAVRE